MSTCNNCGHGSHCGVPLQREERDYDGSMYSIKVCNNCRCNQCQKEDNEHG